MNLRPLLSDLKQIIAGAAAFLGYLFTKDPVAVGFGELSTESTIAVRGRPSRYLVTIGSMSSGPSDLTLTVAISPVDSPSHPDGQYAYFSKRVKARPLASTRVEIQYDWGVQASFLVERSLSSPDGLWRGGLDRSGRYAVSALLLDPHGNRLDFITVYQELTT